MNKKAQERFLSIWNVVAWMIVATVVLIGIYFYNNAETNIQQQEARILNHKIINCITDENGILIETLNKESDILETCSLNKKLFEEDLVFLIEIEISYKEENKDTLILSAGNPDLGFQCDIKNNEKQFADCFTETLNIQDKQNRDIQLKIRTSSNNRGRKI